MMNRQPPPLIRGKIRFIENRLPAIESGSYRLCFAQEIAGAGVKSFSESYSKTLYFAVAGDRVIIVPDSVDSVFPAPGSQGDYQNVLPHLVLKHATLPWERHPTKLPPVSDLHRPAWFALLLFAERETPPAVQSVTLQQLKTLPDKTLSYPDFALGYGESWSDPCLVIDVDFGLFQTLAPTLTELSWLAHVRSVDAGRKANRAPAPEPVGATEYAVVMGSRLPLHGTRSTVHLVSLEGMEDFLPGGSGVSPAPQWLRLLTLHSWTFDTFEEPQTFAHVVSSLDAGPLRLPRQTSEIAAELDGAVAAGYVGVEHHLRDGGRTASWYRGPLAPYPVAERYTGNQDKDIGSADAVLSYDPSSGLLDASYAAAWQLGRMLAFRNKGFAEAMLRWKHELMAQALEQLEVRNFAERSGCVTAQVSHQARADVTARVLDLLKRGLPELHAAAKLPQQDAGLQPRPARHRREVLSEHIAATVLERFQSPDPPLLPAAVEAWIKKVRLLQDVPFRYLVPYESAALPETLRVFYVDANWTACIVDGGLSLGAHSSADWALHRVLSRVLRAAATPMTGFLLRSRAVQWWPGMEVTAHAGDAVLPVPRFEHISPQATICLIAGVADTVDLHQPPEGIHFGLSIPKDLNRRLAIDPTTFYKDLRDPDTGIPVVPTQCLQMVDFYRTRPSQGGPVLMMAALAKQMNTNLGGTFTAAEFAMEMIEGVDLVSFPISVTHVAASKGVSP
ncbi:MAG: hypothetical protein M3Y50_15185 [Acidobacteriota bacterium]|nr:hypothetical protein [Acidobacteriota bacterium]